MNKRSSRKNKNNSVGWPVHFITFVFIAIFIFYVVITNKDNVKIYNMQTENLDSGWVDTNNNPQTLSSLPPGTMVLRYDISKINIEGRRFCLKSTDTFFYVYADGKKIYTYHPEISALYGSSYGMFIHQIFIPDGTKQLKLKIIPAFEHVPASLNEAMIADSGMYVSNVFKRGMSGFCTCLVMFILGVATVAAGFIRRQRTEFITLGMFAMLASVWSVNNTLYLQMITDNPALIRFLNYTTLILLPYPPVSFLSKMTKSRSVLIPILKVSVALNFTVSIILAVWKVADYHELVSVSQAIVILSVCVVVIHIIQAIRHKTIPDGFIPVTVIGASTAIAGVMIDLIRYNIKANGVQGSGGFTRIGIALFLLILTIYMIKDYSRAKMEGEKAELMEKLAHTDALTGLKNRLSFNEAEMVMKSEGTSCIIIQLDINDLKKVNDIYGHSEGDKHICAAAEIIRDSFDHIGVCYRTGGDEFITVTAVSADEQEVEASIERLKEKVSKYNEKSNPPVKLAIAYGYAECDDTTKNQEEIEVLADKRMYECKIEMKRKAAEKVQ